MGSLSKGVIALVSVLAAAFLLQPYRPVIVRGESMAPTFSDGQLLFSVPLDRKPKVGDIVLVETNGTTLIKRVTMVAGDAYIEARPSTSPLWSIVTTSAVRRLVDNGIVESRNATVPEGTVYIAGDNPQNSLDSRLLGFVPISAIRGRIVPI